MSRSGGGAATAGGMDYQNRVSAWMAAHILAEKDATVPWNLPVGTTLDWFRCEVEQPVDDMLVGTSANGLIFAQCKRTLDLSEIEDSDFASTIDQFVRQFITCKSKTSGKQPFDRPLDSGRDRLVLITSPRSSELIKVYLPSVLNNLRRQPIVTRSLDIPTANDKEGRALSISKNCASKSWLKTVGVSPSAEELLQLFSLIHVQILDPEAGNDGEREARTLLRTSVLLTSDEAEKAWAALIAFCASCAKERSGTDRRGLQRDLLITGFKLNGPRSYQGDIQKLKAYSDRVFADLASLAQIKLGNLIIKIQRETTGALKSAAEVGSILVVGEPGAGKSGTLHDLVKSLKDEGRDCLFLAVDRLAAKSLGELRNEIGLDHEVIEVLENWPGTKPAFLVIDALDAARGEPAGKMIRELIHSVVQDQGRWQIVASIRKFDLRYGTDIKDLFEGPPVEGFRDPNEFGNLRHLNVPRLSDGEMGQITSQSADLGQLIRLASAELQTLLRAPFNLRLLADLLGRGVQVNELTAIKTHIELLERYWSNRVIGSDGLGDAREAVLRKASEKMVEARALRINRSVVAEPANSLSLSDVLSNQILIEWQSSQEAPPDRYILAFSHNVLFDYAVSRLLLRGTTEGLIGRFVTDPDQVIVIRPSLLFHFRYLWVIDTGRLIFWELVIKIIKTVQIPQIGKLIGPSVSAHLAKTLLDVEPLYSLIEDPNPDNQKVGEQVLWHIVGALVVGISEEIHLVGKDAGPWCQLLERLSRNPLKRPLVYRINQLLSTICSKADDFTTEQNIAAGLTARRLLEFAWSDGYRENGLVISAIEAVCLTFGSDVVASASLIRVCLEATHLSAHGFEEMPWLTRKVKDLMRHDPKLVEDIYRAVFSFEEKSEEKTQMGQSQILSMTSSRRQDYGMAQFELANEFLPFLEIAPMEATRALISVIAAYIAQRHTHSSGQEKVKTFDFEGRQVQLLSDHSSIWDEGFTYSHDDQMKILEAFQQYLNSIAGDPEGGKLLRQIVDLLILENKAAVIWRRLITAATSHPVTLGRIILPFTWSNPILICIDTSAQVGDFLKVIFPGLEKENKERIEKAVLEIPELVPAERKKSGEYVRNKLIGCLLDTALVTDEAKVLLNKLKAENAIPPNDPPVRSGVEMLPYGEIEYLKEQGVPVEDAANTSIQAKEKPVKEFSNKHLNSTPSLEEVAEIFPLLQTLCQALSQAQSDGVHPLQRDHAWDCLAGACARIAKTEGLDHKELPGSFIRTVLLVTSQYSEPVHDPEYDAQFNRHPSWGSPAARVQAAQGCIALAKHIGMVDGELFETIERLSRDSAPQVRFQIASSINGLYETENKLMWRIIDRMSAEEENRGVLQGLLSGPLNRLAGFDPDKIANVSEIIFERIKDGDGAATVHDFCIGIFSGLYIWRDHPKCREIILGIISKSSEYPDEVGHIIADLREALTHGPVNPPDHSGDEIRKRAVALFSLILNEVRGSISKIEKKYSPTPFNQWSLEDQGIYRNFMGLLDRLGNEVYFASGAFDVKRQGKESAEHVLKGGKEERFYLEASSILEELTGVGVARVAHHLVETLEFFIAIDPRGVFQKIGLVVKVAQQGGYQNESLAADLIVKLVERYLAEYQTLLREDSECRQTLINILDVFVQAGWPSARRLTYRLEEIFR